MCWMWSLETCLWRSQSTWLCCSSTQTSGSFWAYFKWSWWNPFNLSISNDTVRQISQHLGGQFWSKSSPNEELTERISHIMKGLAGVNSLTVTYNFFKILKSPWINFRQMQSVNWPLLGYPPQEIHLSLWSLLSLGFLTSKVSLLVSSKESLRLKKPSHPSPLKPRIYRECQGFCLKKWLCIAFQFC